MAALRFGDCTLDFDARQLFRNGQPVRLSPKAFELMRILVTERPKAISKSELHDRIWPGTFVTEDSLARLVAEVRSAIGDHARTPVFLRTVHAYGYAFSNLSETGRSEPGPAGFLLVRHDRHIVLTEGENIIGRDPAARVVLDSIRSSRRHAAIVVRDRTATIEDLGSRNGTILNGAPVTARTPLHDGDDITIAGITLKFRAVGDAPPTEADE